METRFSSIKELVEPIIGGFWGETTEIGNGNARVVRNGDILDTGEINEVKIPERKLTDKEINKSKLNNGDIVITMSGNVGRVARIRNEKDSNNKPYVASNFIKILRAKKDLILPEYLFFILRSEEFKRHINKHVRGVAIQNLSVKIFDQKIIPIVSKKEQERIVALLEQAEELKNKRAEADQKMEELVPALFNDMFGNLSQWPKIKLRDIAIVKIGPFGTQLHKHDYIENGTPIVNPTHIVEGKIIVNQSFTISEEKTKELNQYIMHTGDIVLARRGEMGRSAIVSEKEDGYLCGTGSLFITPTNQINPYFLNTIFSSIQMKKTLEENARGVTMKNLNINIVENICISNPPIELQNQYERTIKELMFLKHKQEESVNKLKELFTAILTKSI